MDFEKNIVYCIEVCFYKASNTYSVWAGGWELIRETDRETAYRITADQFLKRRRATLYPGNINKIRVSNYVL